MVRVGENRNVYSILVGKPEERRLLGRPRCRLEDNIKMVLKKWDGRAWSGSLGLG